ncbi:unnamed protein product [Dovyalis caffra]|uniref:Uncharacterized protein n=1 Tax=Dovyalis caffra TaxID=77055 RepID=A0AAV1SI24_9ROSI|nr:unnamed protein product [Dovyalis caffra]
MSEMKTDGKPSQLGLSRVDPALFETGQRLKVVAISLDIRYGQLDMENVKRYE